MPITKSAKKALRQNKSRRLKNLKILKNLKESVKTARKELTKKSKIAPEKVKTAIVLLDKAAKRNIIHKNKAGRLKSKLMKKLAGLKMTLPKKLKIKDKKLKIQPKKSKSKKTTEKSKTKKPKPNHLTT